MKCVNPIRRRINNNMVEHDCNVCLNCLKRKRFEWSIRLYEEWRHAKSACFLTLTYDPKKIPLTESGRQTLHKPHITKFLDDLRPLNAKMVLDHEKDIKSLSEARKMFPTRYYLVGEYGTKTDRPHYHAIMFNLHIETQNAILKVWDHGFIMIGTCSQASIQYVTKYVIDSQDQDNTTRQKPFSFMSKRPGLGSRYLEDNPKRGKYSFNDEYILDGRKVKMPRYYADRIYNRHEKEALKIAKNEKANEIEKDIIIKIKGQWPKLDPYRKKEIDDQFNYDRIREKSIKNNKL